MCFMKVEEVVFLSAMLDVSEKVQGKFRHNGHKRQCFGFLLHGEEV